MKKSNLESPVFLFFSRVGDCIWMSLLWLVCSLPIVTIGASSTALIRNMMHLRQDKESGTGFYFRTFAENFKKATICWLLSLLAAGVLFLVNYFIGMASSQFVRIVISILLLYFFIMLMIVQIYTFPLLSYFENTVGGTLKNAMIIGIQNPLCTLLGVVFMFAPLNCALFLTGVFLRLLPLWIFIWPGLAAYVMGRMYEKVFRKYMPVDEDASQKSESEQE